MMASQVGLTVALAQFDLAFGVPDSITAPVLGELHADVIAASREDRAIAMALGATLAGRRALVFLKNAGLGYALDAILSLAEPAGLPVCLLVGGAGLGSDRLAHHEPWGKATLPVLAAAGLLTWQVRLGDDAAPTDLRRRLRRSWDKGRRVAIVLVP
jgi:phosphonopyruvate decarboxylase